MKSRIAVILGMLSGLLVPFLSLYLVGLARPELVAIQKYDLSEIRYLNIQLMTVAMMPNAALFFVALQFEKDQFGRGLLASSLLLLVLVFIYRFML